MLTSDSWQVLELKSKERAKTLLEEAEHRRMLPRLRLRKRIALWLKTWAARLETEPYVVREEMYGRA